MREQATPCALDYQPRVEPVRKSQPAYTFGGKSIPEHLKSKTPGPGHYEGLGKADKLVRPSASAITISHRTAGDRESERKPGPDAYDPTKYVSKEPRGATIKFRNDRPQTVDAGPGPGEYNLENSRPRSEGKSFGVGRNSRRLDNGVPGPGYYAPPDAAVRRRRASWSIGKSERESSRRIEGPGPGQYVQEPVLPRDAGHSAASDHKSAPSFTFGGRCVSSRAAANPGPGDYGFPKDPGSPAKPAYTIKGVTAKEPKAKLPGPGAYEPARADAVVRSSAPALSIAWRHEDPGAKDVKPGPGAYSPVAVDSKLGVSIKFRNRMDPDNSQNPAPHDYANKDFHGFGDYYQTPGASKGFTMGARMKDSLRDSGPGPQYSIGASTLGVAGQPSVSKANMGLTVVL